MLKKNIYITTYTMMFISGNFLMDLFNFIVSILDVLSLFIGILLCVAFYTLAERKFMGSVQRRLGPNVVGFMGMLQAFADALKLIFKELVIPYRSNRILFIFAPFMFLTLALLGWSVIPLAIDVLIADIVYGLLFIYLVSSLSVFGVIIAGWSSNSKYPFLGALRSAAQMISYEVSMGFILIIVCILSGTFNIIDIVLSQKDVWFIFLLFPLFLMFLVSILAETNRAPFDLPEAEAELVAGYNLEYSGIMFAMFFLAEYSNMLLMSILTIHLFLGGWYLIPLDLDMVYLFISNNCSYFHILFTNFYLDFKLYFFYYILETFPYIDYIYIYIKKSMELFKFKLMPVHPEIGFLEQVAYFYLSVVKFSGSQICYTKSISNFYNLVDSYQIEEPKVLYYYIVKHNFLNSFNLSYFILDKSFLFTGIKLVFLSVFFVLTRAALPRYRYDQLMYIGWKSFLPFTLGYLIFIIGICFFFGLFPDAQGNPFFNYYLPF